MTCRSCDRYVLEIENTPDNQQLVDYYFVATQPYLGNKRGAYGQTFSFDISYQVDVHVVTHSHNAAYSREVSCCILMFSCSLLNLPWESLCLYEYIMLSV